VRRNTNLPVDPRSRDATPNRGLPGATVQPYYIEVVFLKVYLFKNKLKA
jgi:hypothetical protein